MTRVRVVDKEDEMELSTHSAKGVEGVGIGKTSVGGEMWFTNLKSDSSYVSHSMAVRVW